MTLLERITSDMKEAMKQKNNATLSTLRLLLSAIKNKKIDLQHEMSEEEVQDVVKSQVKQLKDAVVSFEQGGRADLAESSNAEIAVLEAYLPAQLADDVLETMVKEALLQAGITGKQDMGKAMGIAMKAVAGKADGTRVKQIVERVLSVFAFVLIGVMASTPAYAQVAFESFDSIVSPMSYIDVGFLLRIARVMLMWIGIFAVNTILSGGFAYMTDSSRDANRQSAQGKITSGFISSIVVVILFAITTVYIDVL